MTVPGSRKFWAAPFEIGDELGGAGLPDRTPAVEATFLGKPGALAHGANTTIAIVATNASLTKSEAQRMAIAAHDGIARAVVPAHTPFDGDLVFAASSGAGAPPAGDADLLAIGHAASLCLARAIRPRRPSRDPGAGGPASLLVGALNLRGTHARLLRREALPLATVRARGRRRGLLRVRPPPSRSWRGGSWPGRERLKRPNRAARAARAALLRVGGR